MGDEIIQFLHKSQACRADIRLPHKCLCSVWRFLLNAHFIFLLSSCFIYWKVYLTSFTSFPHSSQLSSKLSLLLDVLVQAVDLGLKVLGKVCPLCFHCWCQQPIFNGKWLWMKINAFDLFKGFKATFFPNFPQVF